MLRTAILVVGFALAAAGPASAEQGAPSPLSADQKEYLSIYRELVETDTTLSQGSCTLAAERMAAHLRKAGFDEKQVTLFADPAHPREGGLVAILPGSSQTARPMLLLAHLDVVEARREDWKRDPFTLIQEEGYFYGRGTIDIKNLAATWIDTLIRLRKAGFSPKRSIKVALTCGEETSSAFNGVEWLVKNRPDLVDAEFVLNEGGFGITDGHGKVLMETLQVGEKTLQNFTLETTNPGGHSSFPVPANAIYELADAIERVRGLIFPAQLNDVTRIYFRKAGAAIGGEMGAAMTALSQNPANEPAQHIVSSNRIYNGMLRTTCVATTVEGGHATNALPQRGRANVNCRIFPGDTIEGTRAALIAAIGNPAVSITTVPPVRTVAKPPPLDSRIMKPAERAIARYLPKVPLIPSLLPGATDAVHLQSAGVAVYGVPAGFLDPDGNGGHGENERNSVPSVFTSRDILFDMVKSYSNNN